MVPHPGQTFKKHLLTEFNMVHFVTGSLSFVTYSHLALNSKKWGREPQISLSD